MPPSFVAERSLSLKAQGYGRPWWQTCLIVSSHDQKVVGSCGFKSAPLRGSVHLGYGVAEVARGQGAATAAVAQLCRIAFGHGATEVVAETTPENLASMRVLQKLGFVQVGSRSDEDGEQVLVWTLRASTAPGAGP